MAICNHHLIGCPKAAQPARHTHTTLPFEKEGRRCRYLGPYLPPAPAYSPIASIYLFYTYTAPAPKRSRQYLLAFSYLPAATIAAPRP